MLSRLSRHRQLDTISPEFIRGFNRNGNAGQGQLKTMASFWDDMKWAFKSALESSLGLIPIRSFALCQTSNIIDIEGACTRGLVRTRDSRVLMKRGG